MTSISNIQHLSKSPAISEQNIKKNNNSLSTIKTFALIGITWAVLECIRRMNHADCLQTTDRMNQYCNQNATSEVPCVGNKILYGLLCPVDWAFSSVGSLAITIACLVKSKDLILNSGKFQARREELAMHGYFKHIPDSIEKPKTKVSSPPGK